MRPFDVILWDIDGTLLRGRGLGRASFKQAMTDVFGTASTIDTHEFGGKTDWYTLLELLQPEGFSPDDIAARIDDYATAVSKAMAALIPQFPVETLPQAVETVQAIRARGDVLQGIVTGNVYPNVAVKLSAGGFDPDWFPFGAYGHESANRNDLPPKALQRAIELAGREIPPSRVLVVGDTLMDIEAARALGAKVCCVETGFTPTDDLKAAKPDYLIPDLTHFEQVFPI